MRIWITSTRAESVRLREAIGAPLRRGPVALRVLRGGAADEVLKDAGGADQRIPKLGFGESGPQGERWITLKPHGDEGHSVRVLIRPSGKDGTARVIGGAGGRLNYLKLQLKTPEQYKQQAALRKQQQREQAAKQRQEAKEAGGTPKPGRNAALKKVREDHKAAQEELHRQIAEAMGWQHEPDPESLRGLDDEGQKKAIAEHRKKLRADVRAAVKNARDLLVTDAEAREAAFAGGISFAGGPGHLGAEDLIGTDGIRRGLGYKPMVAGLSDQQKRAEKARFLEQRMREETESGTPAEAALLARRLAEHRAIAPDEVAAAPPQVLAGLARAVADRLDHLDAVTDEDDEDRQAALHALRTVAEQASSTEDALDFAHTTAGEAALRDGLRKAAELGLLDPDKVEQLKEQAENQAFERVGAPQPDQLTAEAVGQLSDEQVAVLADAAAKRARQAIHAPAELREEAAQVAPAEKKRRGQDDGAGRDPEDDRTIDLEDAIEAKRRRDAVAEEAISEATMSGDDRRDFLRRAVEAGVIGQGGERQEPQEPPRNTRPADPQQAYQVLLLHRKGREAKRRAAELEDAVREGREVPGVDYDPSRGGEPPAESGRGGFVDLRITEDDATAVQQQVERDLRTMHARALLGTVDQVSEALQTQAQLTPQESHQALQTHLAFGAADALNQHAQHILGGPSMDRQVIDTLGAEGAAQLLAWAAHTHRADEAKAIGEAVGDFHEREQSRKAQQAMTEARAAWEEAHALHQHMTEEGPRGDLKEWAALNAQRLKHLDTARQTVARALGSLEATAALHAALTRKPPSTIRTALGSTSVETATSQAHAIGLEPDDFHVDHDGTNAWLNIKPSGMAKLVRPPDAAAERLHRDMEAIKAGDHDEKGWLPRGFARRSDPGKYEGPAAPTHAAPMDYALKEHGSVEEALRTYIAQRVHDGWRPADIAADVQNVGHHAAQFQQHHGDADHPDVQAWRAANPEPEKFGPADQGDMFSMLSEPAGEQEPTQAWKDWDAARKEVAARPVVRELHQAIEKVMPSRDEAAGAVQLAERYADRFRGIASEHAAAAGGLASGLHEQELDPHHAHDAAFRALARHPAAAAAFKPADQLAREEQAGLRSAYRRYFDNKPGMADVEPPGARLEKWSAENPEPARERPDDQGDMFAMLGGGGPKEASPEEVAQARAAHEDAQAAEDEAYARHHGAQQAVAAAHSRYKAAQAKHGQAALDGGEHPELVEAREAHAAAKKEHGVAVQALTEAARKREAAEKAAFAAEHGHTNPEWQEWKKRRDEALRGFRREHAANGAPEWQDYVATHGGAAGAYAAVQDLVRGRYLEDFRSHYQALAGKPIKGGPAPIANADRHRVAMDPEHREHVARIRRSAQARVQDRDARGQYIQDMVRAKTERALQEAQAVKERQTSAVDERPPTPEEVASKLTPRADERYSIGEKAEQHVGELVKQFAPMVDPTQPFTARTGITMDGTEPGRETVKQQRAVKAWKRAGKLGLFLGAGSGKTNVSFGAFGELRADGRAQRGLFAVPSAVQGQFGSEALAYLEPGSMRWSANPGASREERLQAYRDPDTHAVVVTHQSLRDDVTHMVSQHLGMESDEVVSRMTGYDREGNQVPGWSREEMDGHVRDALEKHGAHGLLDFLAVDEGHTALNRAGKRDSHMARVLDSVGRLSKHAGWMTGSPVKNDASEVYDWLAKVAHDKYHDGPGGVSRGEFLRRYGGDLPATKEALQREIGRYTVVGRVDPGTTLNHHHEVLEAKPAQKARLDEIEQAYQRARSAAKRGETDLEALRTLMPGKFAQHDEAEHEDVARRYSDPFKLASIRDHAYRHALNLHPESAKLDKVVELANQYREQGRAGVVFAHDVAAIPRMKEALERHGHRVVTIQGSMGGDAKLAAAQSFQRGDADIIVASDAAEAGVNLQRGSWLIQHDVPQTYKTWDQRQARINRLGQQMKEPDIHTLLIDHEHEHRAWDRLERKRDLQDAVMDGAGESLDDTGIAPYVRARLASRQQAEEEAA